MHLQHTFVELGGDVLAVDFAWKREGPLEGSLEPLVEAAEIGIAADRTAPNYRPTFRGSTGACRSPLRDPPRGEEE